MADFADLIVQFFRIDPTVAGKYASAGPIYQIFFLLFLPSLFVILFIWILTSRGPIAIHKGFKMLVSIAIYAFLILMPMQSQTSFYNWFVVLSEFWIFLLIILGVFYMVWARGGTKGGYAVQSGGQASSRGFFETLGGGMVNRLKRDVTHETGDMEKMATAMLDAMEKMLQDYRGAGQGTNRDNLIRAWADMYSRATATLQEYRKMLEVGGGITMGRGKYDQLMKRLQHVSSQWDHLKK
jgi:hypothetical protein